MGIKKPRLLLAAPASGSGKTSVTCALLEVLRRRGYRPVSFKCGPDYIDPMFHRAVLQVPSWNLDSFFTEEPLLKALFQEHAKEGDIAVIEGVMGYYDGLGGTSEKASTYEIAALTDSPVILVADARGASVSLAAQIRGLMDFKEDHHIAGIILNRVSPMFAPRLKQVVEEHCGVPVVAALPEKKDLVMPSRHLGLCQPEEREDIRQWISDMADLMEENGDMDLLIKLAESAPELTEVRMPEMQISGGPVRIAVAKDEAFSFYYEENLELLKKLGAELCFFSPLRDKCLPEGTEGLILGGGYPELHAEELSRNRALHRQIRQLLQNGLPVIAECGGFLYLQSTLHAGEKDHPMLEVFPGRGEKKERLVRFGYIEAETKKASVYGPAGTRLKGHEFHYYDTDHNGSDLICRKPGSGREYEAGILSGSMAAGFPHFYFYSNPRAASNFLDACRRYSAGRKAQLRWDTMGKPIDGLGKLEEAVVKLSRIQKTDRPTITPRALLVLCADHGVVSEGVTQTGPDVTKIVAENIASGRSTVNVLAAKASCDVFPVDVGMLGEQFYPEEIEPGHVIGKKIRSGTGDILTGPAMTGEELEKALELGEELVEALQKKGYELIALGEMGIGNTTPASVLIGLLTGKNAADVTGRGAGLAEDAFLNKVTVVQKTMDRIRGLSDPDPKTFLREGGGLEMAVMTGVILAAAKKQVPVILDGAITAAAALCAVSMEPSCRDILLASHMPQEPGGKLALEMLGLPACIQAELSLGEGTGAMMLLPLLDGTLEVYETMKSFEEIQVAPYKRYGEEGSC